MNWISVNDTLPQFTHHAGGVEFVFVIAYSEQFGVGEYIYTSKGWGKVGISIDHPVNVTDWMPLPEHLSSTNRGEL